jgi:hypothetical protein
VPSYFSRCPALHEKPVRRGVSRCRGASDYERKGGASCTDYGAVGLYDAACGSFLARDRGDAVCPPIPLPGREKQGVTRTGR